ncbi:Crp/Fnr family transcriptional regulator [Siminovitchia sediminis]|uniref:Crp/Fnr family transcriptional regulator n=1 Tax=Siminovitchia sediminis TaxID=1274353 RepID=A0ABW4KJQ0_9BACI
MDTKKQLIPWDKYLQYGRRVFYKKKSVIFQQGDAGTGFYYIYAGLVKITSSRTDQTERIIDIANPEQTIGEFSLLDDMPSPTSAIAQEDSVLYYFTKKDYMRITQKDPNIVTLLAQSLFLKEQLHLNKIHATGANAHYKIALSLIHIMDASNSTDIQLTKQDLSRFAGVTRMTVHNVLKEWESQKILFIQQRNIHIINPCALKEKLSS